ncbi:MAG: hypothetical protein Q8O41_03265 [Candidatus Methanoperedens sp.]|nr:hypothetical protein [Candidatus Methanoperedens sp.]
MKTLGKDEIEKRLRAELKGLDIDKIASEVEAEVDEAAKRRYSSLQ